MQDCELTPDSVLLKKCEPFRSPPVLSSLLKVLKISTTTMSGLLLSSITLVNSGCSPVKGYAGPERPPSEVATVTPQLYQEYDIPRSASIDGIPFGDTGISLLPGKHTFNFTITRKGPKLDCDHYSTYDDAGFNACLSNKKYRDNCSCWDYVSVKERCFHEVRDVNCRDTLLLQAGTEYQIIGSGDFSRPSMDLINQSSAQSVRKIPCTAQNPTTQPFEETIGTGQFTAEQYNLRTACN